MIRTASAPDGASGLSGVVSERRYVREVRCAPVEACLTFKSVASIMPSHLGGLVSEKKISLAPEMGVSTRHLNVIAPAGREAAVESVRGDRGFPP